MLDADKIYHADAFDLFPQIDDASIDLIVCDGPYGVTSNRWDNIADIQAFNLRLIKIFAAKMKDGAALYLFGKPNCIDFIDYRPYLNLRSKIVWYQPSRLARYSLSWVVLDIMAFSPPLGGELWRAQEYIDTMSDADTVAPIGCPKTDTHAAGKCTNAAIARGNTRQTPGNLNSLSMSSGRRFRCVQRARAYRRRRE